VTNGPTARLLTPTLTSGNDAISDLMTALRAALNGSGPALALLGPEGRIHPEPAELGPTDDDPADPTAVAVTTSGSSGVPKTVLLSAAALLASAGATHDRLGGPGQTDRFRGQFPWRRALQAVSNPITAASRVEPGAVS
jgi:acyl-CoA synthetase (AMP-forming)/AMP-acid ligase II